MIVNVHLLGRVSKRVAIQLLCYERIKSSEKETLHGTAPDQEEKRVNISHSIMLCHYVKWENVLFSIYYFDIH